jgi:hypothetical protein
VSTEHFQQESDVPAIGRATLVIAGALGLFLIGVVIWGAIMYAETGRLTTPAPAPDVTKIGQREIGMVIQPLFDIDKQPIERFQRDRERLGRYGWIDRRRGIVHIPIERAMELVAQEGK